MAVADVSIAKDVEKMVAHAIETFGQIDYAVNNAGIEGKFAPKPTSRRRSGTVCSIRT